MAAPCLGEKMSGKRCGLIRAVVLGLLLCLLPLSAWATKPKVAVLPFLVHAKQEDQARLAEKIELLLLPAIITPSMEVIPTQEVAEVGYHPSLDSVQARRAGGRLGADYVIYGSLTKLGGSYSLDARLLEMSKETPLSFHRQGEGEESLKVLVSEIARDLKGQTLGLKRIVEVEITGNQRIEDEALSVQMKSKPGQFLDPDLLNRDLKKIFAMGYFSDVRALTEDVEDGSKVVIEVNENPAIREIEVEGGTLDKEEIIEAFNVPTLTVFNGHALSNGLQRVGDLFRAAGYLNVEVTHELGPVKDGLVDLTLKIAQKNRLYIKEIKFSGNEKVPARILRKQMETDDWGIFSFITDSGVLKKEVLEKDLEKIRAYYQNNGFLKAQVGDPDIRITEKDILVVIPINEGEPYTVGLVKIEGDLIKPAEELKAKLTLTSGKIYSRAIIEVDREALINEYASIGHAKVSVVISPKIDAVTKTVNLKYRIRKGPLMYVERINIHGNTRTRDKVIRRELRVREGDLVNLASIRRSAFNLRRLQFFDEVEFNNLPGSADDKLVMDVRVKERSTGALNFGVGYSTTDSAMIMLRIQEQNLFGRGQRLIGAGNIGFKGQRYSLSFIEPYLFDRNLSLSLSAYNTEREYTDYNKDSYGGYTGLGFPFLFDFTRMNFKYTYETVNISQVEDEDSILKREEGRHYTSKLTWGLKRDSRDLFIGATKGSENFIQVDFAGLGGTTAYTKVVAGSSWFFPAPFQTTFHVQGKIGYVLENEWGHLPSYEKFFLGGINSLRGFSFASVSPRDPETGTRIGGEKMMHFNVELIFPLIPQAGVKGVVFYDAGNVWTKDGSYDLTDLRQSIGGGIRWYSPIGPLRLEYGYIIKGEADDGGGGWEFTIGSVF